MSRSRVGASLVEAIVALLCGLLIIQLALHGLAGARVAVADQRGRADGLATRRSSRTVLRHELGVGVARRDWTVHAPDSVTLRAYRAVARICPTAVDARGLLATWTGQRRPDPAKDSLLLLDAAGHWTAVDLVGTTASADRCPGAEAEPLERWRVEPSPERPVVLARVFERGSYHFSGRAFRYRTGAGGRQPLSPEVLAGSSGLVDDGRTVSLRLDGLSSTWSWRGFLARQDRR